MHTERQRETTGEDRAERERAQQQGYREKKREGEGRLKDRLKERERQVREKRRSETKKRFRERKLKAWPQAAAAVLTEFVSLREHVLALLLFPTRKLYLLMHTEMYIFLDTHFWKRKCYDSAVERFSVIEVLPKIMSL